MLKDYYRKTGTTTRPNRLKINLTPNNTQQDEWRGWTQNVSPKNI